MNVKIAKILAILYVVFISLFAFDTPIFTIGFLIHLIPSFIFITATIIAWKKNKIGGIIFLGLFLATILFFSTYKEISIFLIISLPLLIIGLLFIFGKNKPLRV